MPKAKSKPQPEPETPQHEFSHFFRSNYGRRVLCELHALGVRFQAVDTGDGFWPAFILPSGATLLITRDDEGNGPGALHVEAPAGAPHVVISPDGLPIQPEPFPSRAEAEAGFNEWVKRFTQQGYYAGVHGRVELDELQYRCRIEPA